MPRKPKTASNGLRHVNGTADDDRHRSRHRDHREFAASGCDQGPTVYEKASFNKEGITLTPRAVTERANDV
jgi:hypothetical protein